MLPDILIDTRCMGESAPEGGGEEPGYDATVQLHDPH